jgi:hypothetical protein
MEKRGKPLSLIGIWMKADTPRYQKYLATFVRLLLIELFLILQLLYLTNVTDLLDFTSLMSTTSTYISYFTKAINFVYFIGLIEELIKSIRSELVFYQMGDKFWKRIRNANRIFVALRASAFATTFFGGFVPFFSPQLAYKMWFPYDLENPVFFWMSAIYQHIATILGSLTDVILDMAPAFFMVYVVAMLEELCEKLEKLKKIPKKKLSVENVNEELNEKSSRDKLIEIIHRHQKLCEITKKIEIAFNSALLVRGVMSTLVFCTTAFSLIMIKDLSMMFRLLTYVIPTFLQLLIPCYFGNEISALSDKLSTALFHSEWYLEEDMKYRQLVLNSVEFMQRKIKISSGVIFQVNLETFLRICNSAFSLYAVFKSINK